MGDLRNLQTLLLVECVRLKKVELGGLINLKHLSVRGCENLKLRGIDGLMSLQTLDKYYVQDGDEGNKLEHLRNLNHLQGRLTIETVRGRKADAATEEEAADAEREEEAAAIMVKKAHLVHLVLNVEFGLGWNDMMALQPPPRLESLRIHRYKGKPFWTEWWSSLHSLRLLTLTRYDVNDDLPWLANLASLESLSIKGVSVRMVGVEFWGLHAHDELETSWEGRRQTSFPKLKQLTFDSMFIWKEWEGVKGGSEKMAIIMPCLSELTISWCHRLKALPELLWKTPLQKLHISNSPILMRIRNYTDKE
ncbi:hypothetical protein ACLB2K_076113 [Fragaria x ananassa]